MILSLIIFIQKRKQTSLDECEKLHTSITEKYDVRCIAIQCDVSKEEQVDKMISQIEKEMGNVDVLINNAAIDLSNLFHNQILHYFFPNNHLGNLPIKSYFSCITVLCY